MRPIYDRACSYAWKCNPYLYKDLVHDAWVQYYTYRGKNLFDQPDYYVFRVIRNIWFNHLRSQTFMWKLQRYSKQNINLDDYELVSPTLPPDKALTSKEFCEDVYNRVKSYHSGDRSSVEPEKLETVLTMLIHGYSNKEIGKHINASDAVVSYYKKKIKSIINDMQSPFAGDKIKISKKITRKTYEENKEKYGDYKYDPEKGCDFNEFFMTMVGPNGDYLLIKE